ncbi:phosphotransferase [Actinacidiphila oryziradicis]|uniref:Aminoglycoside phosphotransferase domain-containing protein n=1 Tax=Actinacidiphila oryziradicis TaxID=2571141 RepID=A0A4U0SPT7_9ACTN|nr:phosphotransferase [Actinacidiphila oryziradicis]TKA12074.1 hypothetical protein FCI23_07110 [Actinacidiphila oryziradicis]
MSTAVSTSPSAVPRVEEVFAHAERKIRQAAAVLWAEADVVLGGHVPSVTGYVRRLTIDDRDWYAKYSFLGISLVSLLRGTCGDWDEVRAAQAAYVRRPDGLMEREVGQLRFLAALGRPRVCGVLGSPCGVLFTRAVPGPTLASLLLERPQDTAGLLEAPFRELTRLHRPATAQTLGPAAAIGERSVSGTFLRKFNGLSGTLYVDRLGAERCDPAERAGVVELLRRVVARLHRLRTAVLPSSASGAVLTFGDLKPEHVFFPSGPDGQPVFIDPGLLRARLVVDVVKLISRTILLMAAAQPSEITGKQVAEGISAFAEARVRGLPRAVGNGWLHELLVLWLMDSINILTTYLSAPAALPISAQGEVLVKRAAVVCAMADQISDDLAVGTKPDAAWEHGLAWIAAVAA